MAADKYFFFNRPLTVENYKIDSSTITQCTDGILKKISRNLILIAQNNYAPFSKNRREISTIQKKN
jgi:hypothetical protein